MTIIKKCVIKEVVEKKRGNSEIMIILNRYKNTLDNFINNVDQEFLDWQKQIDKVSYKRLWSKNNLIVVLEGNC